ncbi:zinc-ribbon domain-containing protein [Liquorilactobacillus sicerae]|uniref:zinc-ribbon domain-containing protein n=1 Tax=Liquorilactobacillus sicerae TaxID=1416943 RepID=UPI002480E3F2|nr:zinc-ribbon domain-containing protein [Liquorilactobacillus sicerae]
MKYCQRCGRKIEENVKACPYCAVLQEQKPAETKNCKKCQKKIPVNANYCPFCGADQAFFYYQAQQPDAAQPSEKPTTESKLIDSASHHHSQSETAAEVKLPKNESVHPGLKVSTRLLIHDTFKVSKRMGRADYWWAFLGLNLMSLVVGMILGLAITAISQFMPNLVDPTFRLILSAWITFVYITITTAQVRRLHDCGWSAWLILMKFIFALGDLFIIFAMVQPQSLKNRQYTFKEKTNKR